MVYGGLRRILQSVVEEGVVECVVCGGNIHKSASFDFFKTSYSISVSISPKQSDTAAAFAAFP